LLAQNLGPTQRSVGRGHVIVVFIGPCGSGYEPREAKWCEIEKARNNTAAKPMIFHSPRIDDSYANDCNELQENRRSDFVSQAKFFASFGGKNGTIRFACETDLPAEYSG
jgi:hypothetical protein